MVSNLETGLFLEKGHGLHEKLPDPIPENAHDHVIGLCPGSDPELEIVLIHVNVPLLGVEVQKNFVQQ